MIALIPARKGSKRIPGKNTKLLAGHPLIAYTIQTAIQSQVFDQVWVCADDLELQELAQSMGACFFERAEADDRQTDAEWVHEVLTALTELEMRPRDFAILRPTSPFRTPAMLQRAYKTFYSYLSADSVRAVEPCTQHPGKMWTWEGRSYPIKPLLTGKREDGTPWHSCPTQTLPTYYVQNASLDMAWTRNIEVFGTIHGQSVVPFFCEGHEGFDINYERDWREAEYLLASGAAYLPEIPVSSVPTVAESQQATDSGGTVAG